MPARCMCAALLAGALMGACSPRRPSRSRAAALSARQAAAVRAVGGAALQGAASDSGRDWLMYGRDFTNRRYSPLQRIDVSNVGGLRLVAALHTGAGTAGSFQSSPVVIDGIMYVTTPRSGVVAFDLRTGRRLWAYQPALGPQLLCCGNANRGVAISHGVVYVATLDARLVALDAVTGSPRWSAQVDVSADGYSLTMAPLVVDSLVIVGTSGAEYGVRGHVSAYHAETGRRLWRWYTVPSPAEGGWWGRWRTRTFSGEPLHRDIRRERADSAKYADAWRHGGGSVWTTPAYDPTTGLLYVGIGNPSPPFNGTTRPGDNLYTGSIVALDAHAGRLRWYHQYLPHDVWDLDAVSPPVLAMLGTRPIVLHAGKIGWVYVLDAATGRLLRRSQPFIPQQHLFTPPTTTGVVVAPGANGGANWSPMAYSPRTGLAYVVALHQPMLIRSDSAARVAGAPWYGGDAQPVSRGEEWGTILALNPATGKITWQLRTDRPMVGGSVVTAGGLVFTGEGTGWFRAYDALTGRRLWEYRASAGVNAPPVTFEVDGRQFVAVAAGGNTQQGYKLGDTILVFGLVGAQGVGR